MINFKAMKKIFTVSFLVLITGCATPPSSGRIGVLPTIEPGKKPGSVVVIRDSNFVGSANNYYILLDGRNVFAINSGEYTEFKVNEGDHTISVKCFGGWALTWKVNTVKFSISSEMKKFFEINKSKECAGIEEINQEDGLDKMANSKFISTDVTAAEDINHLGEHIFNNLKNLDNARAIASSASLATTIALSTPGNDATKTGAGLNSFSQSLLNSANNINSSSGGTSDSISTASLSYVNPNCPPNLSHLSPSMPLFSDPMLSNLRREILATSMSQIISGAKQQGMSKEQTIDMAMRQAKEFENTAEQNAKAGSDVSTYLTSKAIVTAVNNGRLSLSLPCSHSPSMVEAAECAVIQQVWGATANSEIAKQIPVCW